MKDPQRKLKRMYNKVMAQVVSTSRRHLFAGNQFGDIFVIPVSHDDDGAEISRELTIFPQGAEIEINSLCFHRDFLIVGAIGVIYGLAWNEERGQLSKSRKWEVRIPMQVNGLQVPDVNHMWLRAETDHLFVGCGNNIIYQISLEDGRIVRDYQGHTDYVHCVTGLAGGDHICSASEDGTVRLWSESQKESTAMLEPHRQAILLRPEFGKWIGAVAISAGDWLICGGGPKLSIWYMRSLQCIRDCDFPGPVHVCDFVEDNLFVAGEHNHVQFYTLNGVLQANIPVDSAATYSAAWQLEPAKFMSIAGFSNKLHILKNFNFLDSKMDLYTDK